MLTFVDNELLKPVDFTLQITGRFYSSSESSHPTFLTSYLVKV